jgi:hypothetical protein
VAGGANARDEGRAEVEVGKKERKK